VNTIFQSENLNGRDHLVDLKVKGGCCYSTMGVISFEFLRVRHVFRRAQLAKRVRLENLIVAKLGTLISDILVPQGGHAQAPHGS
jgi:hypothetical protein